MIPSIRLVFSTVVLKSDLWWLIYTGLTVDWTENDQKKGIVNVPPELYEQGCIHDVEAGMKVNSHHPFIKCFPLDNTLPHALKWGILIDRRLSRWDILSW